MSAAPDPSAGVVSAPPLALYLHFPWCVRKCPYCDFNSHEAGGGIPEDAYVAALLHDLDRSRSAVAGREIISVFLGGGTPSLFSAAAVTRLLDAVRARLPLAEEAEITLEANPGTAEARHFAGYRRAGVNRLSLGVQSFDDESLRRLGRIHDGNEARRAFELARAAGFDNINLDLMYGLPEQSSAMAAADLEAAVAQAPEHLSWYQLTLEPNTVFYARPPVLPVEDAVAAIQEQGEARLEAAGYRHYEVSAWCRAGREARHNLNYWEFGDYLGLGAGAHSKLTGAAGRITRSARHRIPRRYLETAGDDTVVTTERVLDEEDRVVEFMLNALRLVRGFEPAQFEQRTGLALERVREPLAEACRRGLLEYGGGRIRPTPRGTRYLNDLLQLF